MKYVTILFALMFAMNAPALNQPAEIPVPVESSAQENLEPELMDVAGTVIGMAEDGLTIDTATHGQVFVHLAETTAYEGEEPTVGAYVHVIHNGVMTMSLPPQITALRVGCYAFTGEVTEVSEESFMLETADGGVYQVNAEVDKLSGLTSGQAVTVYSNGAMTMSIPAQIYGELIVTAE